LAQDWLKRGVLQRASFQLTDPTMTPADIAFALALMVSFVDMLGLNFSIPILVPYGKSLGASVQVVALGGSVRGFMNTVSLIWMPTLSDKKGRKFVVILSLIGSGTAYALQGLAKYFGKAPLWIAGRGLAGFFGGTQPVIEAFILDLSMPDTHLLKKRMTVLMVSNQTFGIALAPICGAIASFSLNLPYFLCTGTAVLTLLGVFPFFKDVDDLKQKSKKLDGPSKSEESAKNQKQVEQPETTPAEDPNPLRDPVLILMTFAYLFLFLFVMGYILLIPLLLEEESFDLQGKDDEETKGNIAKAMGLVMIPNGVASVGASILFYVPLTNKFGDMQVVLVAGIGMTAATVLFGFWPSEIWELCVLQFIMGFFIGLITPSIGPVVAKHVGFHYKKRKAEAQGLPFFGMTLAALSGQILLATIETEAGMEAAWITGAGCVAMFTVCFITGAAMVERRVPQGQTLSSSQKAIRNSQLAGMDVDKFIDVTCEELRKTLAENKELLWNEPIQQVVTDRVHEVVPHMRSWDDKSDGLEYLTDLQSALRHSPEQLTKFRNSFPHIPALATDISIDRSNGTNESMSLILSV